MIENRQFIHLALVGGAVPIWLLLYAIFLHDLLGPGQIHVSAAAVLTDAATLRSLGVAAAASVVAGAFVGAALGTGRWWQAERLATRAPMCALVAVPMAYFDARQVAVAGQGLVPPQAVFSPSTFVLLLPIVTLAALVSARLAAAYSTPPN